jgi:hypothetical protein
MKQREVWDVSSAGPACSWGTWPFDPEQMRCVGEIYGVPTL